jgi:hypothetical protein
VPGKPGTDVVLVRHAYAPDGGLVTEVPVSVQVGPLRPPFEPRQAAAIRAGYVPAGRL